MKLPVIAFNQEALSHFSEAVNKEWLVTNGLGGYASSTVLGLNTRKYHGLLVAALHPPGNRTVCLSKIDEDIIVENQVYRLGTNEFSDHVYPKGYMFLAGFSVAPFPTYIYHAENITLTKTIYMPRNENAVSVMYKASNFGSEAKLKIYPMLTSRHFHSLADPSTLNCKQQSNGKQLLVTFQNPSVTTICSITDGEFQEQTNLVDNLLYREDAKRGEASKDVCFQPGYFELQLPSNKERKFNLYASAASTADAAQAIHRSIGIKAEQTEVLFDQENMQLKNLLYGFYGLHPEAPLSDWLSWVLLAADSFLCRNDVGERALIAGYHWFEPWGRDTFISLPGLLLVTGRFNAAKAILETYSRYCRGGLIPNFIGDKSGEPAYNTVDATLWYINAVFQYLKYTGDCGFVQEKLWKSLQEIISSHEKGTFFDIHVATDGLLSHGPRLTWMDAESNGKAVTPRLGKAVEIEALWYNSLRIMQHLASRFDEKSLAERYRVMADKARASFNSAFWNQAAGCLYDVVQQDGADASLRPNQIFAISLDYPVLESTRHQMVVDFVNREFLTPYGLRTLSPSDPVFIGKYVGDLASRDSAYHNGTVWPWLLGPFITAYLKTKNSEQSREHVLLKLLQPYFAEGIKRAGMGTLSEICDGDAPHAPRGCIAQAWSVAEPLRAYVEDVLQVKPRFAVI